MNWQNAERRPPKDDSVHTALKMSVRIAQLARERGMDPGKTLRKIQYHRKHGQLQIPEMDF